MSYSCFISFKELEEKDIISFFREFKIETTKNIKQIADENFGYCPYIRNAMMNVPDSIKEVPHDKMMEARYWALTSVFQYRYFYDTENHLLCVFGIPTCMRHLFDKTIYFQDSCDQDYERKEWEGIKAFENIFDKWSKASDEKVDKTAIEKWNWPINDGKQSDKEKLNKQFNYYRRSFAYDEIWSHLANALYDDDTAIYFSLYNTRDIQVLIRFIKCCHEAQLKWQKEWDK